MQRFTRWLALAAVAALVVALPAAAADFTLRLVSQTNSKITLGWDARQNVVNYTFYANGKRVSNTYDGSRTSVTFSKVSNCATPCYVVQALVSDGQGSYPTVQPPPAPACSDTADNDGDGKIDYPNDPGCSSASDTDETDPAPPPLAACADGRDNDLDGKIDYPADPGCSSATDTDETDTVQPPPTKETISPSQFNALAQNGATVQDKIVTGSVSITHTNVTVNRVDFQGEVSIGVSGSGFHMTNSTAGETSITGADNVTLEGNVFDGKKRTQYNHIWDTSGGDPPQNIVIRNNTYQHFWVQSDPSNHSEALFIGHSDGLLIQGNTFFDNGTTSHIFFTTFGGTFNSQSYPRNVCVKGNVFRDDPNGVFHYFAINFHSSVPGPSTSHIVTDPNEVGYSTTNSEYNGTC